MFKCSITKSVWKMSLSCYTQIVKVFTVLKYFEVLFEYQKVTQHFRKVVTKTFRKTKCDLSKLVKRCFSKTRLIRCHS